MGAAGGGARILYQDYAVTKFVMSITKTYCCRYTEKMGVEEGDVEEGDVFHACSPTQITLREEERKRGACEPCVMRVRPIW